jgi:hypothetical protein
LTGFGGMTGIAALLPFAAQSSTTATGRLRLFVAL